MIERKGKSLMDIASQIKLLYRGVEECIVEEELVKKLERVEKGGPPLRVKLGMDPTAPDLHLGHTVVIHKLKQFQDLGHEVYFLIGDFTGMIGDPSGKSETRRALTPEEVKENAKTYQRQIFKILDRQKTKLVFNSQWMGPMSAQGLIELAAKYTVARMLERDDFQKRYREGRPIAIHEFLYPLIQGYDSVALKADVELGGTDQKFNLLVGREFQRHFGQEPQVIMTMPILEGLDGHEKMSKSLGNYIGIDEPPKTIFGKAMSIPDSLMFRYLRLVTSVPEPEIEALEKGLAGGRLHPKELKVRLAKELVAAYHSPPEAEREAQEFEKVFSRKELPRDMETYAPPPEVTENGTIWIVRLLTLAGAASSNSEARRLILQGGLYIDGEKVTNVDLKLDLAKEHIIKAGKLKYFKTEALGSKR
jgi:tyrosyl-tRNA synthetase